MTDYNVVVYIMLMLVLVLRPDWHWSMSVIFIQPAQLCITSTQHKSGKHNSQINIMLGMTPLGWVQVHGILMDIANPQCHNGLEDNVEDG